MSASTHHYCRSAAAWYCLSAQPKREHIAAANIRLRMELEVFCPRITYSKNTERRGKLRFTEALFPGYLFIRCEIRRHLRHLRAMPGIRNVVRYGEDIPIVPDAFIVDLEARLPNQHRDVPDPVIEKGREVVVTEGPFRNLDAVVAGLIPARERVALLLEFLGRQLSVEVSVGSVLVKQEQPKSNVFADHTGDEK